VGQAFAAKHAEAVYIGGLVPSQASYQIKAARDLARAAGRDPYGIKFFAAINPILGRTMEEAQAKYDEACKYADVIGALAQFSGYTGIDMSKYPLDEPLKLDTSNPKDNAVQGFLGNFGDSQKDGDVWTPRKLGMKIAVGGFHPTPVGTPEMVADIMEQVNKRASSILRDFRQTNNVYSGSMKLTLTASTWPTSVTRGRLRISWSSWSRS
jgi:alkanesulfonate monooxygenase SsuD/methylene tetrahydromethanopterin reductase-like flavin-dependent oxidoreductase (luciferase family)